MSTCFLTTVSWLADRPVPRSWSALGLVVLAAGDLGDGLQSGLVDNPRTASRAPTETAARTSAGPSAGGRRPVQAIREGVVVPNPIVNTPSGPGRRRFGGGRRFDALGVRAIGQHDNHVRRVSRPLS